jgi:hypothetical protein
MPRLQEAPADGGAADAGAGQEGGASPALGSTQPEAAVSGAPDCTAVHRARPSGARKHRPDASAAVDAAGAPRGPATGPATYRARILVVPDGGQVAAGSAIVWAATPAATPDNALGSPRVDTGGSGIAAVTIRVGMRDVQGGGLVAVTLHDVAMSLLPVGGGTPIRMTGAEPTGNWPAATYHVRLSQRDAKGTDVPAGRYRLLVTAKGADGAVLRSRSTAFTVG